MHAYPLSLTCVPASLQRRHTRPSVCALVRLASYRLTVAGSQRLPSFTALRTLFNTLFLLTFLFLLTHCLFSSHNSFPCSLVLLGICGSCRCGVWPIFFCFRPVRFRFSGGTDFATAQHRYSVNKHRLALDGDATVGCIHSSGFWTGNTCTKQTKDK